MNSGAAAQAWPRQRRAAPRPAASARRREARRLRRPATRRAWLKWIWQRVAARHVFVLAFVLVYPLVATPFFTFQIGAQSLALGLIALSLTFLGRLRRHGLARADDGGRDRRLHGRDLRHERHRRDQPRLAVVGGGAARGR